MPALSPWPVLMLCAAVVAGAAPMPAFAFDAACRHATLATLPILVDARDQRPMVEGSIDGKPALMLVDTGAETSWLVRAAAEKRAIPMQRSGDYAMGVAGASVLYNAQLKDFSIGPIRSGKIVMQVLGDMSMAPSYDALVGADFLLQADMEVALADRQLRFFRSSGVGCKDASLPYRDPQAMEIAFVASAGTTRNPRFMVAVNGKPMEAMIDSGATHSVITRRAAERLGIRTDSPGVTGKGNMTGVGAARVAIWSATFDTFRIGRETIENAELTIIDTAPQGHHDAMPDVLLGADFLRTHRVLFAMSRQRLYISGTRGPAFAKGRRADRLQ